jgi:histidinol-phosphate/aromatic aminotransferase/cobyric acid decarboxylase-like protein
MGPTYCEYARASRLAGARVYECRSTPESGFAVPVDSFEAALRLHQPKIAFLCNPNNPTGQTIQRELLLDWVDSYHETQFVVDESYIEFAESADSVITTDAPNLIVLRSMTKSYALAGLRLGYVIADRAVIRRLCQRRVPWNVSAPAQAAGVAALEDQAYLDTCLAKLQVAKHELLHRLAARGFDGVASAANFFLLRVNDSVAVRQRLLSQSILVRDCSSFGISNHIRIGVRTPEENARLVAHL